VALYAGLTSDKPLGGVMALSTYLPLHDRLDAESVHPEHVPSVFMAHGRWDNVVPYAYGEASMQRLRELGLAVDWNTYDMEHGINAEELFAIREWLITCLSG
jgi:phospholipase/carboxylesterase